MIIVVYYNRLAVQKKEIKLCLTNDVYTANMLN